LLTCTSVRFGFERLGPFVASQWLRKGRLHGRLVCLSVSRSGRAIGRVGGGPGADRRHSGEFGGGLERGCGNVPDRRCRGHELGYLAADTNNFDCDLGGSCSEAAAPPILPDMHEVVARYFRFGAQELAQIASASAYTVRSREPAAAKALPGCGRGRGRGGEVRETHWRSPALAGVGPTRRGAPAAAEVEHSGDDEEEEPGAL
jgi:hypothetical protein